MPVSITFSSFPLGVNQQSVNNLLNRATNVGAPLEHHLDHEVANLEVNDEAPEVHTGGCRVQLETARERYPGRCITGRRGLASRQPQAAER